MRFTARFLIAKLVKTYRPPWKNDFEFIRSYHTHFGTLTCIVNLTRFTTQFLIVKLCVRVENIPPALKNDFEQASCGFCSKLSLTLSQNKSQNCVRVHFKVKPFHELEQSSDGVQQLSDVPFEIVAQNAPARNTENNCEHKKNVQFLHYTRVVQKTSSNCVCLLTKQWRNDTVSNKMLLRTCHVAPIQNN